MPSKFRKAIAAVKDHTSISFAKVSGHNSSNLDVAILKATTHEEVPVEDRYVNEVIVLTTSSHSYASACVQSLSRRITRTRNWIVAVKSLILIFRILQEGDSHFPKAAAHAMKHGMRLLNLSSFRDDSNSSPWDYTAFVRTFALYLDERLDCFLMGKLHVTANASDSKHHPHALPHDIHDMKPAVLLDKMAYWQRLLDRVLATRPTGTAKTNRLVQISLCSIVKESFDLYREISDGLKFLLDNFFHLQHRSCIEAFHICTKATTQFDELAAYYSFCKSLGIGWNLDYPSVQKISDHLLETLQEFLKDHQASFQQVGNKPKEGHSLLPPPSARLSPCSYLSEESSAYQDCGAESNSEEEEEEEGEDKKERENASESSWGPESSPDAKDMNASASASAESSSDNADEAEEMNMKRVASDNSAGLHMLPFDPDNRIQKSSSCMAMFQEEEQTAQRLQQLPPPPSSSLDGDAQQLLKELPPAFSSLDGDAQELQQAPPPFSSLDEDEVEWEAVLAESASRISGPLDYSNTSAFSHSIQHRNNPFMTESESSFFFEEVAYSSVPALPTFSVTNPELELPPEEDPFSSLYCIPQSPANVLPPSSPPQPEIPFKSANVLPPSPPPPPEIPFKSAYHIPCLPHALPLDAAKNRVFKFPAAAPEPDTTSAPDTHTDATEFPRPPKD